MLDIPGGLLQIPVTRKKGGEQARLDLARSLNAWEIQKEHVFLDGFVSLAQAYAKFFKNGSGIMKDMDSFVGDMQQLSLIHISEPTRPY